MSFLEKLLADVDVELIPVAEIGELVRGNGLPKTDFTESGVPAIHYGQIYTYYGLSTVDTKSFVSSETAKKLKKVDTGDVIVTNTSENLKDVGKALVYLGTQQAVTGGHATIFKPSTYVLGKYFAYYTQTEKFAQQKRKFAKGAKVIDFSATDLAKIKIPIPSPKNAQKTLEIQAEIVRILDIFSAMAAELTAELNLRKKQYKYYLDKLLSFKDDEVEWKALGEVANFANGKGHEKDIIEDGEYIVVNSKFISSNGRVAKYSNKQICPLFINDILLVMSDLPNGKALAKTFIVDVDDRYTLNQRIGRISIKNKNDLHPKFLYYFLNRNPQLTKFDNGVDQTNLRKDQILGVKIPILSLTEQTRIVTILDKFDTLIYSINEGLPREIELRQQQYEYYRDLLFSFPKSEGIEA
ncbi:restriction endonuclease subunit S [Acinetobacter nosocomialis]|uniref:restriction endonuclease subunit S n=1 Tax=Acinetobacter nosocomialis TaxID=106654 RepID=UPI001B821067|nr:restriction endonuclease subunit S [Acinetobacter nosocomialis]MBR7694371.1 restriction endonuclease subunit S [Acinetobacter nosocomialis]HCT5803796.1 restriction endonuclease subunit S [Acinetobacter nosocomialis]